MSDTKWEVGETYRDARNPGSVTEITDGSGYVVAYVPRHDGSCRSAGRNLIPPMIAAAPEMHEALTEAREFIENLQLPDAEWPRVLDIVSAALAKAVQK